MHTILQSSVKCSTICASPTTELHSSLTSTSDPALAPYVAPNPIPLQGPNPIPTVKHSERQTCDIHQSNMLRSIKYYMCVGVSSANTCTPILAQQIPTVGFVARQEIEDPLQNTTKDTGEKELECCGTLHFVLGQWWGWTPGAWCTQSYKRCCFPPT